MTETYTINVTKVEKIMTSQTVCVIYRRVALCAVKVPVRPPFPCNNHTTDGETSKVDNFIAYEIAYAVVEIGIAGSRSLHCGSCFAFMAFRLSNWHASM